MNKICTVTKPEVSVQSFYSRWQGLTILNYDNKAKLQGSERLGGSIMTDVLVYYMIWTEQVNNTACSVWVYCKDNQLRKVYGCVILYISRDIQKYTNPRS